MDCFDDRGAAVEMIVLGVLGFAERLLGTSFELDEPTEPRALFLWDVIEEILPQSFNPLLPSE